MELSLDVLSSIAEILERLYGADAAGWTDRIAGLVTDFRPPRRTFRDGLWDQRDVVLITYGDQVRDEQHQPLQALRHFLLDHGFDHLFSIVHLLPCFPFTSDDGFAVKDYRTIDPRLGTWDDVGELKRSFDLMLDLVLNHCSRQHPWFQAYLAGQKPYDEYFIEVDPATDLSAVVRPRSSPLLTPVETSRGVRYVWTTFSDDQIDLNYANPAVLTEILSILLEYVERGTRIIRLDAIAYLWKRIGTPCIHLPEVHLVVKLMRGLLDAVAPGTLVLTETNVPHKENIGYFGDGDEAHIVYQFSLAPLLLDAYLSGDAQPLMRWLHELCEEDPLPPNTTFLNFTASHDGIGVRPLEGLVSEERFRRLIQAVTDRGGLVNTRRNSDGTDTPYELNITYFDALGEPQGLAPALHARRFLSTQAVMLALPGIPAVYFHSLTATPNDQEGVKRTGHARAINRRRFTRAELDELVGRAGSPQQIVFAEYKRMLGRRVAQPAFHPAADQQVIELGDPALISFLRCDPASGQRIWTIANTGRQQRQVDLSALPDFQPGQELLSEAALPPGQRHLTLPGWQTVWLSDRNAGPG